jgi:hypothetical protein
VYLELTPEEEETLHFLLDMVTQEWDAKKYTQLGLVADDPSLSLEQVLAVSESMQDMNTHAKNIKAKLEQAT